MNKIETLIVRTVAGTFRRCGIAFSEEAMRLDPSVLSKKQVAELKAEPALVVSTEAAPEPDPSDPAPAAKTKKK